MVTAIFKASATSVCKPGDEINFTNSSIGSGTLSYEWDFGDGTASNAQSPKHTYTAKGTYIVTLTVKSSDGCQAVADPVTINVANFSVDFSIPPHICQLNENVVFFNKSTPGFTKLEWAVDGDISYTDDLYKIITAALQS